MDDKKPILKQDNPITEGSSNTKATSNPPTRRDFLTLAWKGLLGLGGILGLGGLIRYFSYQPYPSPPTAFDLGSVSGLPRDSFLTVTEAQAILIPTEDGYQAFSLICPHLGCEVDPTTDGFYCPCHGSLFNHDGSLAKGPADQPLRSLRVLITEDEHLILLTAES